jgi:hypothetical protein
MIYGVFHLGREKLSFRNFRHAFRNFLSFGRYDDLAQAPIDSLGDSLLGMRQQLASRARVLDLCRRFRRMPLN